MAARRARRRRHACGSEAGAMSPAHQTPLLASSCARTRCAATRSSPPAGLLKHELRRGGSLVIACADATRVPAGEALAVERFGFARLVTTRLALHPRIRLERRVVDELPEGDAIVATGPLTEGALGAVICGELCGDRCTSTTRSRRSSPPSRSIGRSRSAPRAGAATPRTAAAARQRRRIRRRATAPRATALPRRPTPNRRLRQLPARPRRVRGVRRRGARRPQGRAARLRGAALLRELHADRGDGRARPQTCWRSARCGRSGCAIRAPATGRGRSSSCARRHVPDGVQPGRVPDPAGVSRAAADLPDDPRPRRRRVPALRLDPSQHVRRCAAPARRRARAAQPPERSVRGPAHRRRGLHRVVRDGPAGRPLRRRRARAAASPRRRRRATIGALYHHVTRPRAAR